ncbi:hypothetical protein E6Q11_06010 [Candidatus Dojkabacteria bacterium]|uniref:Uncharacterized protein n=1 Tax=Candidatus Dojkabacteria bacterium TaxID=2099670 RepID=A0A5C7J3T7_9BACT|nr:MAG: hypothetical protein E6Q11_06010 [Candidatus Dojkabacteria bacterium]
MYQHEQAITSQPPANDFARKVDSASEDQNQELALGNNDELDDASNILSNSPLDMLRQQPIDFTVLADIQNCDVENTTPMQALTLLCKWKAELKQAR